MKFAKSMAVLTFALISLGIAGPVLAWSASANTLVSTSPTSKATLTSSPSAVTITSETTLLDLGNSVTVTDPAGTRVNDGTLSVSGTAVVAGLRLLTVSGVYTVTYELLANNEAPLDGSFTFTFTAPKVITSASPTIISPSATPNDGSAGGSTGVPPLIIAMILAAVVVFVLLSLYAWKLIAKR